MAALVVACLKMDHKGREESRPGTLKRAPRQSRTFASNSSTQGLSREYFLDFVDGPATAQGFAEAGSKTAMVTTLLV